MSRFGEPKPVERIKALPQEYPLFKLYREASIYAGLRNSTVSPKAIVENKNVLKIIFGKAFWEESVFGRM